MKIRPLGAELFHADRQTDVTKLIVDFRNFVKEVKKLILDMAVWDMAVFEEFTYYKCNSNLMYTP
jgi:hypothetical protein